MKLDPPASLWRDTAIAAPEPEPLSRDRRADIVILGGGYTGLSAAMRAIERGLEPVVLEAGTVGFGASGRNGGVVSNKYRLPLSDMAARHGIAVARRMGDLAHEAVHAVEHYVEELGMGEACFVKSGNLRCAHNRASFEAITQDAHRLREILGDDSLEILDAGRVAAETGTTQFVGGVLNHDAGIIHPLNYARGLAAAVRARGGAIHENSPVLRVETDAVGVRFVTTGGTISARRSVLASNGYSDMTAATAPLRRAVIPFRSAILATGPLPASMFDSLIPQGRSYSETRRMMRWFRRSGDYFLFGGRGAFGTADSEAAFGALETAMRQIFPQLGEHAVSHRWSGLVAMTMDSLPQIGLIGPRCAFSLGYNGTGIAMSTLLGRQAADLVMGESPDLALMYRAAPRAIPFFFLREPAVRAVAGWYQFLDRIGR